MIDRITFSTQDVLPKNQIEYWCSDAASYIDINFNNNQRRQDFPATASALRFGGLMLYDAHLPPYDHGRREARIKRDSLDHWIIALCRGGHHRQQGREHCFTMEENVPHVLSMARPFKAERSGHRIDWLALFVPRDSAPEFSMALDAACDRPLAGSAGQMFAEHLLSLQRHLGKAAKADAPRIERATLALLEWAVNAETMDQARSFTGNEQMLRSHIKALIRKKISSPVLTPDQLASMAAISRSHLYRLFEPLGGVMRYVHRERLRLAYRLICDPNERRSIGSIAESVGFFDPSAFSRAFRQAYGCSPRDVRWSGVDAYGIERTIEKQLGRDAMLDLLQAL